MSSAGGLILFQFGSRSGSLFALALFGSIFAALGWAIGRNLRNAKYGLLTGLVIFAFPMALIYGSSLNGFYEAALRHDRLELYYLLSPFEKSIPVDSIREVRAIPAFKLRWRLVLIMEDDTQRVSATWNRPDVQRAADQLRELLEKRPDA